MAGTDFTIIMTGSAGMASGLEILESGKEKLEKRYPLSFLQKAKKRLTREQDRISAFFENNSVEWKKTEDNGTQLFPMSSEGVFGALWTLGETLFCGLKVTLSDIPIDQAVIEFCDLEDINPYEADAKGAYLIATSYPGRVLEILEQNGIRAVVIGYCNSGNARIVKGATERYLTKP